MKKIVDEVKHLWTYHIFKVIVVVAVIAVLIIIAP